MFSAFQKRKVDSMRGSFSRLGSAVPIDAERSCGHVEGANPSAAHIDDVQSTSFLQWLGKPQSGASTEHGWFRLPGQFELPSFQLSDTCRNVDLDGVENRVSIIDSYREIHGSVRGRVNRNAGSAVGAGVTICEYFGTSVCAPFPETDESIGNRIPVDVPNDDIILTPAGLNGNLARPFDWVR